MEWVIKNYWLGKIASTIIALSLLIGGDKIQAQTWLKVGIVESVHYDHFYNKDVHEDPDIKYKNKFGYTSGISLGYDGLYTFGANVNITYTNYNQDFIFTSESDDYLFTQKLFYYNFNFLMVYQYKINRRNSRIKEINFGFGPQANIIRNAYGNIAPYSSSNKNFEYYEFTKSYKKLFISEVLDFSTQFQIANNIFIIPSIRMNYCMNCDAISQHGHAVHQVWSKYSFISAYFNDTKILTIGLYAGINYKFKISDKHYSLATTRR